MKVTIEVFDANGALKTAIATVPAHAHTGAGSGGQLDASAIFSAGQVVLERGGTESDLGATGPGVVVQASSGAALTVTTTPKVTQIRDSGDNEGIIITATGSAVNEITVTNAATGNSPSITASGGNTDIDLSIGGKGTGNVKTTTPLDMNDKQILKALYEDFKSAAAPANPSAGYVRAYLDSGDGHLKQRDSSGAVIDLTAIGTGFIVLEDQKAATTDGGTFNNGADRVRTINTEVVDTGGHCSLASDQFTLAAGTYRLWCWAAAYKVDGHQCMLYDVTGAAVLVDGSSMWADAAGANTSHSRIDGYRFTIGSSNTYEIRHVCTTSKATNGFGIAASLGNTERYLSVVIIRE